MELQERPSSRATGVGDKTKLLPGSLAQPLNPILSVSPPPPSPPETRQRLLQTFLGEVVEIHGDEFVAIVKDQTDRTRPDERVTIAVDEVDDEDRPLLTEGSMFYWFIFDEVRLGTRRTLTDLRFRRLPKWSTGELAGVKRRAGERARRFGITSTARI